MNKDELVLIGKITGVFGIKGELKVFSESDFIDYRFRKGAKLVIANRNNYKEVEVSSMRVHKNNVLITIDDLKDINLVEAYVGYLIYAYKDDEVPLEEDEYLVDELIGFDVYNEQEEFIGKVNDFIEVPQGYIMEIINNGKKTLIPFVDEYILEILEDSIIVKVLELCQ